MVSILHTQLNYRLYASAITKSQWKLPLLAINVQVVAEGAS